MRDAVRDEEGRPLVAWRSERMVGERRVQLRFALVGGRLVCIGLEIGPPLEPNEKKQHVFNVVDDAELDPLRSTEIRLPLRELVDDALQQMIAHGDDLAWLGEREEVWKKILDPYVAGARNARKKPGRPPLYDDDHYKQVAAIYEERLRSGHRDPLRAIMSELKIEKTAAASKVREARRRGFLTMDYFGGGEASG